MVPVNFKMIVAAIVLGAAFIGYFSIAYSNYLVAGLAFFVAGYAILRMTSFKRFLVFFMLETKHGLKLVDRIARLSPNAWKFFGDVATVTSFAGIGSYYVARYRNTWLINAVIGAVCLVFVGVMHGYLPALVGVVLLAAGVIFLRGRDEPLLHAAATAVIMSVMMFVMFPGFSDVEIIRPFVSVLVGLFGIPVFLISMLFSQAFKIVLAQSSLPGVSPLLPTVTNEGLGFFFPGTGIFIPFWQALIAIICLLVPHEFAHGIVARAHKIRLKSAGVLTAGPLPVGAFVEPDEKLIKMRNSRDRMRVYAAGSFTNLIVAGISLIVLVSVMAPLLDGITHPTGMMVTRVLNGTPAYGSLEAGYVITSIKGIPTNDSESFYAVVSELRPGDTAEFVTTNGTFDITLAARPEDPGRGYIGIDLQETYELKEEYKNEYRLQADTIFFITPTLFWIFFLSFNIALVNLLPVEPFDGGKMFEELMQELRVKKRKRKLIIRMVIFLIIALILVNASPLVFNAFG